MSKAAVSICVFLAAIAQAESADDVLKRWDATAKDFHAFSADVKRTQYTKVIDHKENLTAVVRLMRNDKGVFGIVRYTDDNPHTFHFMGDRVEDFKPGANQMDVYDVKKASGMVQNVVMLGFGTSGNDVRKTYVVKSATSEMVGTKRTTRIELVPKDKAFKDKAEKLEVWVPEGESNPIQVKATQPGGDYDLYVYSNVQLLKPPYKDSDFDYDPSQKPNKSTHEVRMN